MVHFTESGGEAAGAERAGGLAPVIPLFAPGGRTVREPDVARPANPAELPATEWRPAWDDDPDDDDSDDAGGGIEREIAERNLLKRLRTRQLSVVEARAVVAERSLSPDEIEAVLDGFLRRGYLDDGALAEQLVHVGVDRKGQGRRVIAQELAKRGVPREVADVALAELPDDDAERALEFARTKARSMGSLARDTALRRLTGQLARRGYGSSIALNAARKALDEGR